MLPNAATRNNLQVWVVWLSKNPRPMCCFADGLSGDKLPFSLMQPVPGEHLDYLGVQ